VTAPSDVRTALRDAWRAGPIDVAAYQRIVLYGSGGFYACDVLRAGRSGDFVTSVELGDAFATLVARRVVRWAATSGRRTLRVADVGGARGALGTGIRAACAADGVEIDVCVVDGSPAARAAAADAGLATAGSIDELPWRADVVVANELLDNLPCRLVVTPDAEIVVGPDDAGEPTPYTVPLDDEGRSFLVRHGAGVADGAVVPWPVGAAAFVTALATTTADDALVLLVDYGDTLAALAARDDPPVRGYRGHEQVDPFATPGDCDVTVEVPFDVVASWLRDAGWDVSVAPQADWLAGLGLGELRDAARAEDVAAARARDTMAQLRAKARSSELAALADPHGMGGFVVCEATRGRPPA
jgi:NADH dehydrogenase [ubiquinone] 1 alpha subcomplex assembly factor 7